MSTSASEIPWNELAGMKSIPMFSTISLHTGEITFTQAVLLNYQLDKMMHICSKKEPMDVALIDKRYERAWNKLGVITWSSAT